MAIFGHIPKFGFGTAFNLNNENPNLTLEAERDFVKLVKRAIELGVRHFDCAPLYKTQKFVGQALSESKIPRTELFLASKLPANCMRPERIEKALQDTLKELQVDYLDMYIIHAPFATEFSSCREVYPVSVAGQIRWDERPTLLEDTWRKMIELKQKGYFRFIGVSNFNIDQVARLNRIHQVDVVQNEFHLYNQDRDMLNQCDEWKVHFEAFAALGSPLRASKKDWPTFENDVVVTRIAKQYGLTNAQVVILWLNGNPLSFVIKSDNIQQLEENLKPLIEGKVALTFDEMSELDNLDSRMRIYDYEDLRGVTRHREYPFKRRR